MKAKQVLAKVFTSAMVFSTLFGTSVMADEIGSGTIYVDTEIIEVTLPTTASQKFYIDPQGLIAVGKDTNSGAVDNAGTVVGAFDMYAINNSSIPLALSVSYKLTDSAESDGVTVVNATTDGTDVQGAATKSIAVSVSAVQSDKTDGGSDGDYTGKVYLGNSSSADMTGTPMTDADIVYADTTAVDADYFMTAATYKLQKKTDATDVYDSDSYEYVLDETQKDASCVKLTIGGYCSKKADWSDYASGDKTLKLDVTFTFKKVTSTTGDYDDAAVGDEVQLGPKVEITDDGVITLSGLTPDNTISAVTDIEVIWPEGSYTLVKGASTYTMDISQYVEKSGTITITLPAAKWSSTVNGKSVKVKVTLTGGSTIESNSITMNYQ